MPKKKVDGICKLTKCRGRFVEAHLIPKALTRPAVPGAPFIENQQGRRPKRAWSSWYDTQLVTAEGEEILMEFDNWAIAELRRHRLVWSGWGPLQVLPYGPDHDPIGDTGFGLRKLSGTDFTKLRLFFLSLLWRAAASTLQGFAEIQLESEELEGLRARLVARDPGPPTYFSIQLTQLSTLGEAQNLVPLARIKNIPSIEEFEGYSIPYFRFYFDGLIAHIHPNDYGTHQPDKLGPLVLGQSEFTTIPTVKYEKSFQLTNLLRLQTDAWSCWPELMTRL